MYKPIYKKFDVEDRCGIFFEASCGSSLFGAVRICQFFKLFRMGNSLWTALTPLIGFPTADFKVYSRGALCTNKVL
jgi:hypothetical protein